MEELVSLCKRRGFIFQSSDIYGGLQGMYDYGPLGVELKNNLKAAWWRAMVYERDDVEGLDAAIDRMKAYVDAGADMIFPEAMKSEAEFEAVRKAIDVPILANMTEFGKSRLLTRKELEDLGFNLVIYPVTTFRLAMGEVDRGLDHIKEAGDQNGILDRMQHRKDLYDYLRYSDYNAYDQDLFNFEVGDTPME